MKPIVIKATDKTISDAHEVFSRLSTIGEENKAEHEKICKKLIFAQKWASTNKNNFTNEQNEIITETTQFFHNLSAFDSTKNLTAKDLTLSTPLEVLIYAQILNLTASSCQNLKTMIKTIDSENGKNTYSKVNEIIDTYYKTDIYKGTDFSTIDSYPYVAPRLWKKLRNKQAFENLISTYKIPMGILFGALGLAISIISCFQGGIMTLFFFPPIGVAIGVGIGNTLDDNSDDREIKIRSKLQEQIKPYQLKDEANYNKERDAYLSRNNLSLSTSSNKYIRMHKQTLLPLLDSAEQSCKTLLETYFDVIPQQYLRNEKALRAFISYFQDGRADTMKEAVNLYVLEQKYKEEAEEKAKLRAVANAMQSFTSNMEKYIESVNTYTEATSNYIESLENKKKEVPKKDPYTHHIYSENVDLKLESLQGGYDTTHGHYDVYVDDLGHKWGSKDEGKTMFRVD